MFDNIGEKIKGAAAAVCVLGIIAAIIVGSNLISEGNSYRGDESLIFDGICIIVGGIFVSWLSAIILYGFGQLIDNTYKLLDSASKLVENTNISNGKIDIIKKNTGYTARVLHDITVADTQNTENTNEN